MGTISAPRSINDSLPVESERTVQNDVSQKETEPINREQLLVRLKQRAADLKVLQESGFVAKIDAQKITIDLNDVIKKLEGSNG